MTIDNGQHDTTILYCSYCKESHFLFRFSRNDPPSPLQSRPGPPVSICFPNSNLICKEKILNDDKAKSAVFEHFQIKDKLFF